MSNDLIGEMTFFTIDYMLISTNLAACSEYHKCLILNSKLQVT